MPLVKRIRSRGATIVVEANAEVLFGPNGPVGAWTRTFSNRLRAFAAQEAPSNKRPRWGHYGKPLKSTMRASTDYDPMSLLAHFAVGSTASYSAYPDQGTGVFNPEGGGPYEAKILPPWTRGGASLYESTWKPTPDSAPIGTVTVKGQRGQKFFDRALLRAFQSARMSTAQVPGAKMASAFNSAPDSLLNFLGNTPNDGAFRAQLKEWRAWRDKAWNRGEAFDKGYKPSVRNRNAATALRKQVRSQRRYADTADRQARQRTLSAERAKKYRNEQAKRNKTKRRKPRNAVTKPVKKPKQGYANRGEKNRAVIAAFKARNPNVRILRQTDAGVLVSVNGRQTPISWAQLYGLL